MQIRPVGKSSNVSKIAQFDDMGMEEALWDEEEALSQDDSEFDAIMQLLDTASPETQEMVKNHLSRNEQLDPMVAGKEGDVTTGDSK